MSRRKPKVAPPVWPSAAIQLAYQRDLRLKIIKPMAEEMLRGLRAAEKDGDYTTDAAPPTAKKLRAVLERWSDRWVMRLETLAENMAREFATANGIYTDRAVKDSFKKAGLTINWRPSKRMVEAYGAVVNENVHLIKSIPRKYLDQVTADVWREVSLKGFDRAALTEKIRDTYKTTWNRAALISNDQTAKAKAVFEAARRAELGIERAVWMHSHVGIEPRPTHVAMNGKTYDVKKGMWDKDEGEWVHPGQLIRCRCSSGAVIPGFD